MPNGTLLWSRHDGREEGGFRWAVPESKPIAKGWNFNHVFSGGDGVIYAVTASGDLLWFRHDGHRDGSDRWAATALDFNGQWEGYGTEGETALRFTIRDNLLTEISCGLTLADSRTLTIAVSPPSGVSDGAVSFSGADGLLSGRIVTPTTARGTLRLDRCVAREILWFAQKRQ